MIVAVAWALVLPGGLDAKKKKKRRPVQRVEDLLIVRCALPGRVMQLGANKTYVEPRRVIKTTTSDCQVQGGQYVVYDRSDYSTALEVWLPEALDGDPVAQTYVGEIYEKGPAGTPDPAEAAGWYRKAAEQDYPRAQTNLGQLYEQGLGVTRDPVAALRWYRRAAGLPDIDPQETERLRERLARAQEELAAARTELGEKIAAAEKELAAARVDLDRTREELAELQRRRQDDQRRKQERRRQEQERSGTGPEVPPPSPDPPPPPAAPGLERRIEELEAEASDDQEKIAAASGNLERLRGEWDQMRDPGAAFAGPAIVFERPAVRATRGPAIAYVPAGVDEMEIRGRIEASAGLKELTVNGYPRAVDADGLFAHTVACSEETTVEVRVEDRQGRRAVASILLKPESTEAVSGRQADRQIRKKRRPPKSGNYHALVVAAAKYRNLTDLATAAADGEAIERLLSGRYGFKTTALTDPTSLDLQSELDRLRATLKPEDRLLIYYAGHGKIDGDQRGYWIPVDADEDDPRTWIPNAQISDFLDILKARHILVVSDSCYSGTLTRAGASRLDAELTEGSETATRRSRTVLTSGGLEPVIDEGGGGHSLFANAFLEVLTENTEPIRGEDLYQEVATKVAWKARTLGVAQTPEYAPIQHAGHEAGDFFLPGPRL